MNADPKKTIRIFAAAALSASAVLAQPGEATPPPRAHAVPGPAPVASPVPPVTPAPPAPPMVAPGRPVRAPRAAVPAIAGGRWAFEGGFLGVELVDLTPELRDHFGAPRDAGVMIGRVEPDSPAARAGLRVGDVVVELDGRPTRDSWELSQAVVEGADGEPAPIAFVRGGKRQSASVQLEKRVRQGFEVGSLLAPRPGAPFPTPAPEALAPALDHLREMLDEPEFGERLRAMQSQVDREVAQKMKELERRLKELEEKLARGER